MKEKRNSLQRKISFDNRFFFIKNKHTCTHTHTFWLTSFGTFGKMFFSEIDYANFSGFKTNSATIYQSESSSWN